MSDENDAGIGARAKEVRLERGLQQQAIADDLGISLRAWQKMERDEGTPSGETLLTFKKLGINPGWILTGLGPKSLFTWQNADAEAEIFIRIGDMIQLVYEQVGVEIPSRSLAQTARGIYEDVMKNLDADAGPDELDATLKLQEARLRRRLVESAASPGTGKRSAS